MAHISIGRVLTLRTPVAWQEAVEVVASASARAEADGTPITLEHCLITTEGTVLLARPSDNAGVLSAMALLQALLEGQTAPAELRALASSAESAVRAPVGQGPTPTGPPDLSWFQRPGPEVEIARLAARALAAAASADAVAQTTRLRQGISGSPSPAARSTRQALWRRAARVGAVAAALVIVVVLLLVLVRTGVPSLAPLRESLSGAPSAVPADALLTGEPLAGEARLPPSVLRFSRSTAVPGRIDRGEPRTHSADTAANEALPTPPAPGEVRTPELDVALPALPPAAADARLYSATDVDVSPPALLHPKLPSEPRSDRGPGGGTGTIEVTIDETGHVLHARLHPGSDASVHDRMLVSAVKAWQFRPATRGGRPVRYLMRVPVAP